MITVIDLDDDSNRAEHVHSTTEGGDFITFGRRYGERIATMSFVIFPCGCFRVIGYTTADAATGENIEPQTLDDGPLDDFRDDSCVFAKMIASLRATQLRFEQMQAGGLQ